jgi:hypothetical protein
MDSPPLQSSVHHPQRVRAASNLSFQAIDSHGAIRKRTAERVRSISASHADRLHQLALEQAAEVDSHCLPPPPPPTTGIRWITPQHSPEPNAVFSEQHIEPFPAWTVPTPPRSDSGVPTVSVDANEDPVTTGISAPTDFLFDQPTTSAEMRSASSASDKRGLQLTVRAAR